MADASAALHSIVEGSGCGHVGNSDDFQGPGAIFGVEEVGEPFVLLDVADCAANLELSVFGPGMEMGRRVVHTLYPASRNCFMMWLAMKPFAPVTKTREP